MNCFYFCTSLAFAFHGHWSNNFVLTNTEQKHQKELCLCLLSWDWGTAGVFMPWLFFSVQAENEPPDKMDPFISITENIAQEPEGIKNIPKKTEETSINNCE